jgi:hypothetical protein
MNTFPAFKEWRAIVEAMGHGAQSIILRKGGISEEGGSFQAKYPRFWLLPTEFHQQLERSKPEAKKYFDLGSTLVQEVEVKYWAESILASYLSTWDEVHALDRLHLFKEEILKERFDYGDAPGLHLLIVRVLQLKVPLRVPWLKSYDGCKSWIDLESIPDVGNSTPVLSDQAFSEILAQIR